MIGELPGEPGRRATWRDAVREIERYRDERGVDESELPLGEVPGDLAVRQRWQAVTEAFEVAQQRLAAPVRDQEMSADIAV